MAITVHCDSPACGTAFPRPDADAGRIVACPKCGKSVPVQTAEPSAPQERTLGSYQLIRPIAKGGMGEVYEARHVRLNRQVALKLLPPELAKDSVFMRRFEREARMAGALNHPNLIQVYDFDTVGDEAFLVMEFIDGEDLSRRVAQQGKLPLEEALRIVEDVAVALKEAHARGIIHRDIKPANILLTRRGEVKVSDLGLARRMAEDKTLTETGLAIGTPHFMSPEQAHDSHRVDHRTDIYSLGITLLYLLTGKRPFDGKSAFSILKAHAEEPLPDGAALGTELPKRVEALIRHMAAKERGERYPDYDALLEDIRRVRRGEEPLCPVARGKVSASDKTLPMDEPASRPPTTQRGRITIKGSDSVIIPQRRRWAPTLLVMAGVTVTVVLAGVIAFLTRQLRVDQHKSVAHAQEVSRTPAAKLTPASVIPPSQRTAAEAVDIWWLQTGGMPPPLPVIGAARNPLPDGTAAELWQRANELAKQSSTSYRTVVAAFEQALAKAAGSPLEAQAKAAVREWSARRDQAGMDAVRQFKAECQSLLDQGNHPQAMFVWSRVPAEVRSDALDAHIWEFILAIPQPGSPPEFQAGARDRRKQEPARQATIP